MAFLSIVAPVAKHGQGMLSNTRLENVNIATWRGPTARFVGPCHACGGVTIINSQIADVQTVRPTSTL